MVGTDETIRTIRGDFISSEPHMIELEYGCTSRQLEARRPLAVCPAATDIICYRDVGQEPEFAKILVCWICWDRQVGVETNQFRDSTTGREWELRSKAG